MPWKVVSGSGRCPEGKPFAVVRSDTDELVACHESESGAEAHKRALYANTEGEHHGDHG